MASLTSRGTRALHRSYRWLTATRSRRRLLLRSTLVVLLAPILLQWVLAYVLGGDARLLPPELAHARHLLLVTAHPDDECLFFAPSVLGVLDRDPDVQGGLLVLSTGNNYGIGERRKRELEGSCQVLGIGPSRCEAVDHPDLQDNPKVWWDSNTIQSVVKPYIRDWEIDAIITFDRGGVSGHINHRAVSAAIRDLASNDETAPPAFELVTTGLLRKYTFLFDLPLTALSFTWRILAAVVSPTQMVDSRWSTKALLANTWHRYLMTRAAFASHESQYSWDRYLYMILSRYVWFNDLRRMPGPSTP